MTPLEILIAARALVEAANACESVRPPMHWWNRMKTGHAVGFTLLATGIGIVSAHIGGHDHIAAGLGVGATVLAVSWLTGELGR